jgi:hypothetical protein
MGLLDAIVSNHFRDDQAGRVVALPVDRRLRGYLVKSESEELKIRAFLKMFYCAEWSLQLVSLLVTIGVDHGADLRIGQLDCAPC